MDVGKKAGIMDGNGKLSGIWFWLGMGLMFLTVLPNLILGENSIFTYHDQLDGEMIAYILQAKHLFSGDILPEFMGGMSKNALTLPAPICVLLFLGGNYFAALTAMQLAGRIAGFAGMYLLSGEITCNRCVAAAAGVLYGLLPFLPVYGLSQYGIPLLIWCALQLKEKRHLVWAYCYVALFGLASSLVLVGFGLLGMGAVWFIWDILHGRTRRNAIAGQQNAEASWHFLAAWEMLLGIYIAENFRLLAQLAGISGGMASHKAEYLLAAQPFWGQFFESLLRGGQHSYGYHGLLVLAALAAAAAVSLILYWLEGGGGKGAWKMLSAKLEVRGRAWRVIKICIGWNVFFALAAAFWGSSLGVSFRGAFGAVGAFQLDRLLWIAPCLWYLTAACGAAVLWELCGRLAAWGQHTGRGKRVWTGRLAAGCAAAVLGAAAGITGLQILLAGDIKSNIQKIRNPDYGLLSYSDYYAIGVMEQVRDFLAEQTGKNQEDYYVISLGIDPAAALYHGFYCLDGYSNNYSLDYKHSFRRVILPELEKSDYLKAYFDEWGNRCYLYSAECPGYYTIEKNGFYFQNYELDALALREMGAEYLLSAAYIQNAGEQGLMLMKDAPFETEDSYYWIYIYKLY